MLAACQAALPVTVAICAAAVADWRAAEPQAQKLKKRADGAPPTLVLAENPDILKTLARPGPARPDLVVGFAAETEDLEANARRKLAAKGCDWIVANDVSMEQGTFGGVSNTVKLVGADAELEVWPKLSKAEVAARLVARIAARLRTASVIAA
jgi:phosphopantothenoylcysteine decarboxylase/phosphopantothenate--cysteine ligase